MEEYEVIFLQTICESFQVLESQAIKLTHIPDTSDDWVFIP